MRKKIKLLQEKNTSSQIKKFNINNRTREDEQQIDMLRVFYLAYSP